LDGDDSGEKIIDLGFKVVTRESTDRNGQLRRIRAQDRERT
jgi:LacI family gluconate utilization system Gnt-I transcriptional repressor